MKIFYAKNDELPIPRIGIAISGRFFNAVQRNSLKRVIREFFRLSKDCFFMMDVVVTVRYSKELVEKNSWKSFLSRVRNDLGMVLSTIK